MGLADACDKLPHFMFRRSLQGLFSYMRFRAPENLSKKIGHHDDPARLEEVIRKFGEHQRHQVLSNLGTGA